MVRSRYFFMILTCFFAATYVITRYRCGVWGTDESVPHQYQYLHQYKLKRICGFLEKTLDNLTSTSAKVVSLIVTSMFKKIQQIILQFGCATARKLLTLFTEISSSFTAVFWLQRSQTAILFDEIFFTCS